MGLTLTILGACGSYAGPGRACSGYLVQGAGTTVWVDAGPGTLSNLQRHVRITDIDAVVISHEHPDHWGDLMGFWVASRYYFDVDRVPIYAPTSVRRNAYYTDAPFDWHVTSDGKAFDIGGLSLRWSQTDHGPETLAVRIDGEGRSMAFSADSGPAWSFERLGSGIDLALCEATFTSENEGKARHMSARQAGTMAREAGVGRLVLTHLEPGTDFHRSRAEATAAFGSPVDIAIENERYDI